MKAEWVNALAAAAAVAVALYGVWVAKKQLGGLHHTLRTDTLMAILTIEAELAARKEKTDEASTALWRLSKQPTADADEVALLTTRLNAALESWLNALDRLCFCIRRDYVPEKDWRAEYQQYVAEAIAAQPRFFARDTRYINTLQLHERWQAEWPLAKGASA